MSEHNLGPEGLPATPILDGLLDAVVRDYESYPATPPLHPDRQSRTMPWRDEVTMRGVHIIFDSEAVVVDRFNPDETTAKAFVVEAMEAIGPRIFYEMDFRLPSDVVGSADDMRWTHVAERICRRVVGTLVFNRRYDLMLEDDRRRGDFELPENEDYWDTHEVPDDPLSTYTREGFRRG